MKTNKNITSNKANIKANMAGAAKNISSFLRACFEKNAPINGPMRNPTEKAIPIKAYNQTGTI